MRSGFTFIEMLVTLGVTIMLSSILFLYNHTGERQIVVLREKARLIDMLLRAKSQTISTLVSETPVCGYGIHLEQDHYLLFRDLAADCAASDHIYTASDPGEAIETASLPNQYYLPLLPVHDIFFLPPDPKVFFDGVHSDTNEEFVIAVSSRDDQVTSNIHLNNAGQISAQ